MRNEITFKNGRRVWTDADITPKVLTELQTQFESEVTEVNRKPLSKHSVLKAKAGTKTPSKPKKTNPNAISWETFEEKYKPQINHILKQKYPKDDPTGLTGWGGIMYETYGDEYEYIREMAQKHPNRVWTLVDGDDGELVIIAGWHYVNRMNYVITEKPWNTGDEYVDDEMAKHGAKINYIKKWSVSYIDIYRKKQKIVIILGRMSNKDDVNYALKRRGDVMEVLSISELYKYGSMVPDNHEWVELENLYTNFESEQQLWEIWSLKQRYHFLKDHFRVELSKAKDQTELQKFEWQMEDTARFDYDNLPTLVKMELKDHKFSGQYKTGGPVKLNVTIELITDEDEPEHLQYGVFDYKGELIEPGFEDINQATTWANEQGYNTDKKAKRGAMIDESQTDLFDKSGVKYRAEVGGIGENRWSGNAMEYDTEDEAKDWLRGLASRWFGYNISRVVPVSVPTNQDIDLSDPLMFQNYRKNAKGTKIRTNSVAVKELIKDLENTPYGVGLALLRERLLTHADYDLKKHKKNPKTFENPIFSVGMYEDLFKRIHKELNFDVSKNNVKAVKDLIKDLASTPHEVGLGLLRERMVAYAENDLEVLKDNPKVFDNPIYNSGMYKDLFNRMIKFCDFGNLTSRVAEQGMKTGTINVAFYKWGEYENDEQMELIDLPLTKLTSEMLEGFNIRPEDEDKHFYAEENDIDDTDVDDGGYGIKRAYATTEEHSEKKPMIDIGSDNIAKRGAKTGKIYVPWWIVPSNADKYAKNKEKIEELYRTIDFQYENMGKVDQLSEREVDRLLNELKEFDRQGLKMVFVNYYQGKPGVSETISDFEAKSKLGDMPLSNFMNDLLNKYPELQPRIMPKYKRGAKTSGVDNTRYPRKADDTGKGIMEGWVIGDGNAYYEKEENALKSVKELGYKTIEEAYDNDEIYFTDWHDEDLDEQGYYYTANGKEVQISSKGSKLGGMERENAEMVLNNNKQISHHTQELASAVKGKSVPAWVVAKVNRSATDLSDATHYLEGTEKAMRGTKIRKSGFIIKYTDENGLEQTRMSIYKDIPEIFKTESSANFTIKQVPAFKIGKFTNPRVVPYLAKAEHGAKTSKGFMVFNYTDDIYASPDTFPTKAKANEFIAQFRKRFEGQGYYRDNRMNKVAPKDIDLLAIPEEFNPYKKN
jgi:hypothetical protein